MKRNLSHFFTLITLIVSVASAQATTTLNTVPEGLLSLDLPLVPKGTVLASNSSLPLIADPVYTGSVSSVTANTISVADNPAPFVNPTVGVQLGTSDAAKYGLTGIPVGPNTAGLPPIEINGLVRLGTSPWRPQFQISQVWQILDNLSWLKGSHSFKFGYEHRHSAITSWISGRLKAKSALTGSILAEADLVSRTSCWATWMLSFSSRQPLCTATNMATTFTPRTPGAYGKI